jgi:hypothetical protein
MEVVDDRGFVQMRELSHVVGLVELGRIDLVDGVAVDLLLGAVVALHQYASPRQVLEHPAAHEGGRRIPQPDIALAREVVLALYDAPEPRRLIVVGGYERRSEGAHGGAVAVRVGAQASRVAASQHGAAEVGEGLVAQVSHLRLRFRERRRDEGGVRAVGGGGGPREGAVARAACEGASIGRRRAHGGVVGSGYDTGGRCDGVCLAHILRRAGANRTEQKTPAKSERRAGTRTMYKDAPGERRGLPARCAAAVNLHALPAV